MALCPVLPIMHEEAYVPFSAEGLRRLKQGLEEAGLDTKYFAWPPRSDPAESQAIDAVTSQTLKLPPDDHRRDRSSVREIIRNRAGTRE